MALLLHVLIALASVVLTTLIFISPTKATLRLSYVLVSLTLVSGTYLLVSMRTHILQACLMGLLYISVSFVGIVSARTKLATATRRSSR
jgi:hypothetical protein